MKKERKEYDVAFKNRAVELSRERANLSELARELGIAATLLYKWRRASENAMAESFFKTLKTELIYGNKLISSKQMQLEIFEYIEIFYSRQRRHSALNYKTIEEFNNQNHFYKLVA